MRSTKFSLITLSLVAGSVALSSPTLSAAPVERSTYLVTFVDGTNSQAEAARLRAQNFSVSHVYENLFPGLAVELPEPAAQALANNPRVALIEPDGIATISDTQISATWGLDRVDQQTLPLSNTFSYPSSAGQGVNAYIIDTGILETHQEFTGRMKPGHTVINDGRGTSDCDGHGTHVAGTVGGTTYGVAKKVSLVPVRVLNCQGSGTWSGVIAGMDWVVANHIKPAVANMSLGGGAISTVDNAVQRLVDAGVTVVVAAGNSTADACGGSPARAANAITVGATTSSDERAWYSNFGSCLDLFAPGTSITSAWRTSNSATNTISGTSMASPHVAGVAALLLGQTTSLTPAEVTNQIVAAATPGVVSSAGSGSPNLLLYSEPGAVVLQQLTITTTSLPNAVAGTAYSTTLQATGGNGAYTWTATGLPSGLSMNSSGTISGTPTESGTFTVNATVTSAGSSVSKSLSLTVAFSKLSPRNSATGVSRNVTVSWAPFVTATSYEVCLGRTTSCSSWTNVGNATSYTVPTTLLSRTTYYWQVRAVLPNGTKLDANSGSIWRFTTAR